MSSFPSQKLRPLADDLMAESDLVQVLGGIADTVAQTLTAIRLRQKRPLLGNAISDGIEMPDFDEKGAYNAQFLSPRRHGPPPFDFERLTRFMSYGFIMSPVQFHWFGFLSKTFPITKQSSTLPVLQRMAFDQFLFAPVGQKKIAFPRPDVRTNQSSGLACFFTFMTVTEGGGRRAVLRKFQDVYIPALKANYMVWPAVQLLNFRVIPLPYQIVGVDHNDRHIFHLLTYCSHCAPVLVLHGPHIYP